MNKIERTWDVRRQASGPFVVAVRGLPPARLSTVLSVTDPVRPTRHIITEQDSQCRKHIRARPSMSCYRQGAERLVSEISHLFGRFLSCQRDIRHKFGTDCGTPSGSAKGPIWSGSLILWWHPFYAPSSSTRRRMRFCFSTDVQVREQRMNMAIIVNHGSHNTNPRLLPTTSITFSTYTTFTTRHHPRHPHQQHLQRTITPLDGAFYHPRQKYSPLSCWQVCNYVPCARTCFSPAWEGGPHSDSSVLDMTLEVRIISGAENVADRVRNIWDRTTVYESSRNAVCVR